jgi:cyclopropane fatty-acyl-phospholipid synthase-like methyltransferase
MHSAGSRDSLRDRCITWLRGDRKSIKSRFFSYPLERAGVRVRHLLGQSWTGYYRSVLNRKFASYKSVHELGQAHLEEGRNHFEYLKGCGLKPHHSLFDFGCGVGRSARYFIDYLEPDRYVGVDIAEEKLRLARELIRDSALESKNPAFIHNRDLDFGWLAGRTFDFAWAHSVFNHMPDDDVATFFRNARKMCHRDSVFIFTFIESRDGKAGRRRLKDWSRPFSWYREVCSRFGFEAEVAGDWPFRDNQVEFGDHKRILRITVKPEALDVARKSAASTAAR